jgi:hypothetical protein
LWNPGVHTDREVMANRPDIIIKNKKNMDTDRCGNNKGQKYHVKGSRKKIKYEIKQLMYRDTTNVEHEMYDCASNNWGHWNSSKMFKEKFEEHTRKTFNRLTTKDIYTWNITHNTGSTAVLSLKPKWWESL